MTTFLRPLVDPATYRGWLWIIVGGALVMPFVLLGEVVYVAVLGPRADGLIQISPLVFVAVLPLVTVAGAVLPLGQVSVFLARTLLRATGLADTTDTRRFDRRARDAVWLTAHLGIGGLMSGVTLALMPFLVMLLLLPVLPESAIMAFVADLAVDRAWGPVVAPVAAVGFIYGVAGVTALARRLAEHLLGPTTAERLAAYRAGARRLAERNRIARELHDSVGHSLSVVTVQADAAAHMLRSDPDFVYEALTSIAERARGALGELDQVLRVLRDGDDAPVVAVSATLAELGPLVAGCGLEVSADIDDRVTELPTHVSREAYRVIQESLTNALRHGDGTADLTVTVADAWVHIEVSNPVVSAPVARVGFGRAGIAERAVILGGYVDSRVVGDRWTVAARFPIRSGA